jgi:hypothetical protein
MSIATETRLTELEAQVAALRAQLKADVEAVIFAELERRKALFDPMPQAKPGNAQGKRNG